MKRSRFRLRSPQRGPAADTFAAEVARGLSARPKRLECRFLYDAAGSELFEQICELPEYYPTRAERSILEKHAPAIAARVPDASQLIELGSGSATKTRLLIEALLAHQPELCFAPIDISPSALEDASESLLNRFPNLSIDAAATEYETGLELLVDDTDQRLLAWLGSSIGNLDREEAVAFLASVRQKLNPEDRFLLGIDLRKDPTRLERAYDDSQGVTAEFNLNLLRRINRELGGDFALDRFSHMARYDDARGRVEMHLVSEVAQEVRIESLGRSFEFAAGETIHTENSYKYAEAEIDELADRSGWACENRWLDAQGLFSLSLLRPQL